MGRTLLPANDTPAPAEFENPANGTHLFEVAADGFEEHEIVGKLVFKLRLNVVESFNPDDVGKSLYPSFWIGTDDDPQAQDPQTYRDSGGWKAFATLLRSTGLGSVTDTDMLAARLPGQRALGHCYTDKRGFVQIDKFFAIGEQPMAAGRPKAVHVVASNGSGRALPGDVPSPSSKPRPVTDAGNLFGRAVE